MKRCLSLATALALVLSLTAGAAQMGSQAEEFFTPTVSQEEWEVLAQTNTARIHQGLLPLSMSDPLHEAARIRANELTENYHSDHTRPDGSQCFSVLNDVSLTDWTLLGENIAQGQRSAAEVVTAWMNSPGHRANILNEGFTHMGAGYDGRKSWEQFFLGDCSPQIMQVLPDEARYPVGTSLEEMGATVGLLCRHGMSYLPVTAEMCRGYDPSRLGKQAVIISYGSQTIQMPVVLTGEYGYPYTMQAAAQELYSLGLFQGKGTSADGSPNFALSDTCTRQEAVVLLLRLLGKEDTVKEQNADHPFTDVAKWASPYVGYAYQNGITQGTGPSTFQGTAPATSYQGITFVLRALGYQSGTDFAWDTPWTLADDIGLTRKQYDNSNGNATLTRGEMALLCRAALDCALADGSSTLRHNLAAQGVIAQ